MAYTVTIPCACCNTERCEDLGSYYTAQPTCPTGMTASQITVTSAATNKRYTCWQCMFTTFPATCADFGLHLFDTSNPAYQVGGECFYYAELRWPGDVAPNGNVVETNLICSSCVPSGNTYATCECFPGYSTDKPSCYPWYYQPTSFGLAAGSSGANCPGKYVKPGGITCWECPTDCSSPYGFASVGVGGQSVYIG